MTGLHVVFARGAEPDDLVLEGQFPALHCHDGNVVHGRTGLGLLDLSFDLAVAPLKLRKV
jgi:hypothetical protein